MQDEFGYLPPPFYLRVWKIFLMKNHCLYICIPNENKPLTSIKIGNSIANKKKPNQ